MMMQVFLFTPEKPSGKKYKIHNDKKSWSEAQKHCREKHTDLVSGLHQLVDKNLRRKIKDHDDVLWIGLFRDGWRWSDGSKASFRNWKSFKDDNSKKCAVTLNQQLKCKIKQEIKSLLLALIIFSIIFGKTDSFIC
uniref:C-type lectin domain-containing protein n=1 Tax=Sparus aurata TaxID=8175 RepID=A0A671XGN9_SPAAU